MKIVAGDVGGTKTLLAELEQTEDGFRTIVERRYASRDFPGVLEMVQAFASETGVVPERVGLGVPGPVVDGVATFPHLGWTEREDALREGLGCAAFTFLNDFVAVGLGIEHLRPQDLVVLQEGAPAVGGIRGVIGAGTGLGQALVISLPDGARVVPSEGGHADYAPRTELELELLRWLIEQFPDHVSYDRVLTGGGLANLYRFFVQTGRYGQPDEVRAELEAEDPAAVVTRRGLAGTDPACEAALDLFCAAYGAEAGNLALRGVTTGGVYVAGGIAPRIVDRLRAGPFLQAFRAKGRLSDLVASVPVSVITNPQVGLLGAAAAAARTHD